MTATQQQPLCDSLGLHSLEFLLWCSSSDSHQTAFLTHSTGHFFLFLCELWMQRRDLLKLTNPRTVLNVICKRAGKAWGPVGATCSGLDF